MAPPSVSFAKVSVNDDIISKKKSAALPGWYVARMRTAYGRCKSVFTSLSAFF